MATKVRIDFEDCIDSDRFKTHSTEWFDRIVFYDGKLVGRNFGEGPGDVNLVEFVWDDECGYAPKVKVGRKHYVFGRFDIITTQF